MQSHVVPQVHSSNLQGLNVCQSELVDLQRSLKYIAMESGSAKWAFFSMASSRSIPEMLRARQPRCYQTSAEMRYGPSRYERYPFGRPEHQDSSRSQVDWYRRLTLCKGI